VQEPASEVCGKCAEQTGPGSHETWGQLELQPPNSELRRQKEMVAFSMDNDCPFLRFASSIHESCVKQLEFG